MTDTTIATEQRLRQVDDLDLEPIVFKLIHPEAGKPGLSLAEADRRVDLYRHFLKLHLLHPEARLVPTGEIDEVWHTHILDTSKYAADCEHVFGLFLHHFPYLGMRGEADAAAWRANGAATRDLFHSEFGIDLLSADGGCNSACKSHGGGGMCTPDADCEYALAGERPRPDRAAVTAPGPS